MGSGARRPGLPTRAAIAAALTVSTMAVTLLALPPSNPEPTTTRAEASPAPPSAVDRTTGPETAATVAGTAAPTGRPGPLLVTMDTVAGDDTNGPSTTTTTTGRAEATTSTVDPGDACFRPAFRDDFDGTTLGDSWQVYHSIGSHSPHGRRSPDAVALVDGILAITAGNDESGSLVGGGLRHVGERTYGRFSARVRTEPDPSNATSGVVLTWPTSNDQPRDGENNFYETLRTPGDRSRFFSYIHEPFDDRADGVSQTEWIHRADASRWQIVTMDWTPTYVTVTREGPGVVPIDTRRLDETGDDMIADVPHFLAVQLDTFEPTLPAGETVTLEVDWVEIWDYCGAS